MPACSLLFTPALLTGIPSTQIERSPTTYTQLKLHKNIFTFTKLYFLYLLYKN